MNNLLLNIAIPFKATETDNKDGNKLKWNGSHIFQLPDSIVMSDVVR